MFRRYGANAFRTVLRDLSARTMVCSIKIYIYAHMSILRVSLAMACENIAKNLLLCKYVIAATIYNIWLDQNKL